MTGPHDDGSASDTSASDAASDPSADADTETAASSDEPAEGERLRDRRENAASHGEAFEDDASSDVATDSVVASVDDDALHEMLDETRTLEGRVQYIWIGRRLVPALFLGALAGFGARYVDLVETVTAAVGVGAAVVALLLVYAVARSVLLYRSWRYIVRADSLYLTRGVFTKVQTVVPYVRVQHIDTSRSAIERLLGLSSLVVYTAGTRGADVTIPGLTPDRAERLQSRLKRLAIESEDEDAV